MTKLLIAIALSGLIPSVYAASAKKGESVIQVYAHRGLRAYAPENSMPAYRGMMRVGADWADMDIVMTKDGEIVVGHDPVLNPDIVRDPQGNFLGASKEAVMGGPREALGAYIMKYAVKRLTLAEVQSFDTGALNRGSSYSKFFPDQIAVDGTHMPTLRDVIHFVNKTTHNKMGFQIEMKTDPTHPEFSADPEKFSEAVAKILKSEKIIDRAEIQAFDFRCLYALNKIDPKIKTAYLTSRDNEPGGVDDFSDVDPKKAGAWTGGKLLKDYGSIPKMVKALGGFAWEPEDFELTETALKEAKDLGLKVVVWSWPEKLGVAFDPKMVVKMIDWKVDGIITDDPGRLNSMLAARGMRVPPHYGDAYLKLKP
jgi:glycerophosphoryl diester phosphodiesterase